MADRIWAQLDSNNKCHNVILLDPVANPDFPLNNLVEITGENPMPGIGWKLDLDTWVSPELAEPVVPDPEPAQVTRAEFDALTDAVATLTLNSLEL